MIEHAGFFSSAMAASALGFGTPGFVGMESDAARERLFARLVDGGVRHFDTAPYYGYGAAESMLGSLIRGRREMFTITTKFGIQPPRLLKSGFVNRFARRVLKFAPGLRRALSRGAQAATTRGAFSLDDAKRSLEGSLRAMKTDYIDLFLLHEPTGEDAARPEMLAFLDERVRAGSIKAYGLGGDIAGVRSVHASAAGAFRFLQFEDSVLRPNLGSLPAHSSALTYRSIATIPRLLEDRFRADEQKGRTWCDRLGLDCTTKPMMGKLLLCAALQRNRNGIVLFSSSNDQHVDLAIDAASSSDAQFAQSASLFWKLASAELLSMSAGAQ